MGTPKVIIEGIDSFQAFVGLGLMDVLVYGELDLIRSLLPAFSQVETAIEWAEKNKYWLSYYVRSRKEIKFISVTNDHPKGEVVITRELKDLFRGNKFSL